jgi:hypothetical protein
MAARQAAMCPLGCGQLLVSKTSCWRAQWATQRVPARGSRRSSRTTLPPPVVANCAISFWVTDPTAISFVPQVENLASTASAERLFAGRGRRQQGVPEELPRWSSGRGINKSGPPASVSLHPVIIPMPRCQQGAQHQRVTS